MQLLTISSLDLVESYQAENYRKEKEYQALDEETGQNEHNALHIEKKLTWP